MKTRIVNTAAFIIMLFLWLYGSNEMYLHKTTLTNTIAVRYIIYFGWLLLVFLTGFSALSFNDERWMRNVWTLVYASAFLLLLLMGVADLLFLHLKRGQKTYIQTIRLFFESPAPFVMLLLISRVAASAKTSFQPVHS